MSPWVHALVRACVCPRACVNFVTSKQSPYLEDEGGAGARLINIGQQALKCSFSEKCFLQKGWSRQRNKKKGRKKDKTSSVRNFSTASLHNSSPIVIVTLLLHSEVMKSCYLTAGSPRLLCGPAEWRLLRLLRTLTSVFSHRATPCLCSPRKQHLDSELCKSSWAKPPDNNGPLHIQLFLLCFVGKLMYLRYFIAHFLVSTCKIILSTNLVRLM